MHNTDLNRVVFHSKEDMAGGYNLQKGEHILRADTKSSYTDINEVLELYNIKKYIDKDLYLRNWTQDDITNFKQKATEYGKAVGRFFVAIDDNNFVSEYENTLRNYVHSFWELVNNQSIFKRISKTNFSHILSNEPHLIHEILIHKGIVEHYDTEIKNFLLTYSQSAEILLSIYEVKDDFGKNQKYLPKSLTVEEKESILSNYLDSADVNYNYIGLIQNARNRNDFKVSDKTRLKAKRLHKSETEKFFAGNNGMRYGVSVSFPENSSKIKDVNIDENSFINYSYSLDFIKQNRDPYLLFQNFIILFEYLDIQRRINLVSKKNKMGVFERIMGVHSQNEYRGGTEFNLLEMTSQIQLAGYIKILSDLGISLENVLHEVFTTSFQEKYEFANNARFSIPSSTSYFEKVRLLAPEFESVLKQFKLFVEDGSIDFELLQISSNPTSIKDIPSLNQNKYIYFNEDNEEAVGCANLFFSDQTLLAYVEPFKEKNYHTFFDLLANEQVKYSNYEEHQKPRIDYLIDKGFINIDSSGIIQVTNPPRVVILRDLYINEVASFYRYSFELRKEAQQMEAEKIIYFGNSLFSKSEQAYFNYFLNKSEFTNGLDLRNSYLHGTQATPDEIQKHEYAYFTYLKLLILTFLKIEDDLIIYKAVKNRP
jgi:L-fucose mutarotase/ribose pyranase (RbsD/FucU family)